MFGLRDAQNLANLAKLKTSEMFVKPVSTDCHNQLLWSLSDDCGLGADTEEDLEKLIQIANMPGNRINLIQIT